MHQVEARRQLLELRLLLLLLQVLQLLVSRRQRPQRPPLLLQLELERRRLVHRRRPQVLRQQRKQRTKRQTRSALEAGYLGGRLRVLLGLKLGTWMARSC